MNVVLNFPSTTTMTPRQALLSALEQVHAIGASLGVMFHVRGQP